MSPTPKLSSITVSGVFGFFSFLSSHFRRCFDLLVLSFPRLSQLLYFVAVLNYGTFRLSNRFSWLIEAIACLNIRGMRRSSRVLVSPRMFSNWCRIVHALGDWNIPRSAMCIIMVVWFSKRLQCYFMNVFKYMDDIKKPQTRFPYCNFIKLVFSPSNSWTMPGGKLMNRGNGTFVNVQSSMTAS